MDLTPTQLAVREMLDDACQVILNVRERLPSAAVSMSADTARRMGLSAGGRGGQWGLGRCRRLMHDEGSGGRSGHFGPHVLSGRSVDATDGDGDGDGGALEVRRRR